MLRERVIDTYGCQAVHAIRPVGSIANGVRVEGVVTSAPSVSMSRHL